MEDSPLAVINEHIPESITEPKTEPTDQTPPIAKDAVVIDHVSFEYPIFGLRWKNKISSSPTKVGGKIKITGRHVDISAVQDISMSIQAGRRVGLCGSNGAGKSTLLRLIAGIYQPAQGNIKVYGKVASIFDRSLGMDVDLTGYENILIRGMFLGIRPDQVKEKADEIASFCDLGDFLHLPIRIYSPGMRARLSFSICTAFDAEILILDEWLGIGDKQFTEKAKTRMSQFFEKAGTVIMASHSEKLIKDNCHEFYQLEKGRIVDHIIL